MIDTSLSSSPLPPSDLKEDCKIYIYVVPSHTGSNQKSGVSKAKGKMGRIVGFVVAGRAQTAYRVIPRPAANVKTEGTIEVKDDVDQKELIQIGGGADSSAIFCSYVHSLSSQAPPHQLIKLPSQSNSSSNSSCDPSPPHPALSSPRLSRSPPSRHYCGYICLRMESGQDQ